MQFCNEVLVAAGLTSFCSIDDALWQASHTAVVFIVSAQVYKVPEADSHDAAGGRRPKPHQTCSW